MAFRIFLWLLPFGLVAAVVLSFSVELDPDGLESAARHFGVGAAAAQAASEAAAVRHRGTLVAFLLGLFFLAWFALGRSGACSEPCSPSR